MKKKYYTGGLALVIAILLFGFFVPLGSYTTVHGCTVDPTPTERLHLIRGETLGKVKENDKVDKPSLQLGCSMNRKYVLYLL